ncbi:hypothetical protein VTN00DRAFT_350 [Thermoascus crustaceus]|uniref:uncharacterized protein n=1 Tax=Thermoascus crustaceus TaxID=5088 RepID=UPI0037444A94
MRPLHVPVLAHLDIRGDAINLVIMTMSIFQLDATMAWAAVPEELELGRHHPKLCWISGDHQNQNHYHRPHAECPLIVLCELFLLMVCCDDRCDTVVGGASPAANSTISSQTTLASPPSSTIQELTQDEIDESHGNNFVLQHIQLKTRASATAKDIRSLRNWLHNNDGAIMAEERRYIDKEEDLFSLVPKDRSPLRRFFERSSFRLLSFWERKPPSNLPIHDQDHIYYSSDKRIDQFVTFTIISAGLCMLIAPISILAFVHKVAAKLAIITVFILIFLAMVSFATNAKPYESLAATAA